MNNQMTSYGAEDKRSSVQQNRIQTAITFTVRKNWTNRLSASGSYSRLAGWQADKIGMSCKIFKILYKLNQSNSYFISQPCLVIIHVVLEMHFSQLFSSKAYLKAYFKAQKIRQPFFQVNHYYQAPTYLMINNIIYAPTEGIGTVKSTNWFCQ